MIAAVAMLASTMVGALLVQVFIIGTGPQSIAAVLLLGALLFVGWTRCGIRTSPRAG
jgi:hypothetical protein